MEETTKRKSEKVYFRLTREEKELILQKFEWSGYKSFPQFFRDAVVQKYVIQQNLDLMIRTMEVIDEYWKWVSLLDHGMEQVIRAIDLRQMKKAHWKKQVRDHLSVLKNAVHPDMVTRYFPRS